MKIQQAALTGFFLLLAFVFFLIPGPSWGAVHTVTSTADDGSSGTLRYTLTNSNAGDTIVFADNLASAGGTATIALSSASSGLAIEHNLTIQGPTVYTLIIEGHRSAQPVFTIFDPGNSSVTLPVSNPSRNDLGSNSYFSVTATLKNLRLKNAYADSGGGILAFFSELVCENCTFADSSAVTSGAAAMLQLCSATFTNCSFTGNTSAYLAGAIDAGASDLFFNNCTFSGNSGPEAGGVMFAQACILQATGCTFSNNSALFSAGAIYADTSELTIISCTFSNNSVTFSGSGASNQRLASSNALDIYTDGGALTLFSGSLNLITSIFSNNTCINSSSSSGALSYGGALSVVGTLVASDCTFEQNVCSASTYAAYGGALAMQFESGATLSLTGCLFRNNTASSPSAGGGALDSLAMPTQTITNCSFIGNSSQNLGGAVLLREGYGVTFTNNTFSENSAVNGSVLYAASQVSGNSLHMIFNTIVDNTASNGSAIMLPAGQTTTVTMTNTLLANSNNGGVDLYAPSPSSISLLGGNFIGYMSASISDAYAGSIYASRMGITSAHLYLTPLQVLSNTTAGLLGMIPGRNSPVRDAAIPSYVTTDMRDLARPQFGLWDSGAIEAVRSDKVIPLLPLSSLILFALLLLGAGLRKSLRMQ